MSWSILLFTVTSWYNKKDKHLFVLLKLTDFKEIESVQQPDYIQEPQIPFCTDTPFDFFFFFLHNFVC